MSSIPRFAAGLNPQQRAAVLATEGPVLVLAGAGSGKTRVITHRVAHLIDAGLACPEEILAVTFTNKAAGEMRERVAKLVGAQKAKAIVVSTFHAFCLRVLRAHCDQIGYRRNFTISSEGDSRTLLRRVVEDLPHGSGDSLSTETFQTAISLIKNTGRPPSTARPAAKKPDKDGKYTRNMEEVFDKYQSALRAANCMDFDDLLTLTQQLWREHPQTLAHFQAAYKYVMVDEYQDTNHVQYALLRQLCAKHRNLCVVGDDDQSIYGWRGADISNILNFERDFKEARVVTLDQNYRSTQTILDAANGVICNNASRREKNLWSDLGKGRPIDHIVTSDEEAEAKEAVKWLRFIIGRAGAQFNDIAVLYRSNLQSRVFEIAFRQAGIPYVVVGGQEFFDRAEVRDILAYLKVIANPRDEAALLRVINVPRRGIGDSTMHTIHDVCRVERLNLDRGMHEALKRGLIPEKPAQSLRALLGMMHHFRKRFQERAAPMAELSAELVDTVGYRIELERVCKSPEQLFNRTQNIEAVLKAIDEYERQTAHPSLAGFLDDTALNTDADRMSRAKRLREGVTLMTVHSAKGLEFPFVFIVGCEEGLLPHDRSVVDTGIEEERRLFYVALTRAMRHVTLFEAVSRTRNGRPRMTKTSRFVHEIPHGLIRQHLRVARDMVEERVAVPKPASGKKRARKSTRR